MDVENANCKLKVSQCCDLDYLPIERPLKIDKEILGLEKLIEEIYRVFSLSHVNVQDVQTLMAGYNSDPKHWKKYAKFDRFRYTRNLVDAGNGAFNVMILCWAPGQASAIHDHADSHCFMKVLSGSLEEIRYDWPDDANVQPELVRKLKSQNDSCQNRNDSSENGRCRNGEDQNGGCRNGHNQNGERQNGVGRDDDDGNIQDGCRNGGGLVDRCQDGGFYHNDDGYDVRHMREMSRKRLEMNDVCYINDALGLHRMENSSHCDGAVSLHLYCPPFDSCRVFDARTGKPAEVKVTFWSVYGKKTDKIALPGNK